MRDPMPVRKPKASATPWPAASGCRPTLQHMAWTGLIVLVGSVLQGAVGFGFSLFAVPALVWSGRRLSDAVAIASISIFIHVLLGTWQLRAHVPWRAVVTASFFRYLTIPLGVALLVSIDALAKVQIKQVLGGILIAVLLVEALWKSESREPLHPAWHAAAFTTSGFLQGFVAMGGPPAVLWAMAQSWDSRRTRAFLLALFMLTAPLQIPLMYFLSQHDLTGAFLTGLAFAPVVAAGSIGGVRIGNLVGKSRLRQAAVAILFVTGIVSILAPAF